MPAYNAAAFLDQSLASVAGQMLQPAEVVVADDCSTDETAEVAERWALRLPLRVLRLEVNAGPSEARAHAIASSCSPLIALLDADDVWLPDHLQTLVGIHERHHGIAMALTLRWAPGEAFGVVSDRLEPVPAPHLQLHEIYKRNFVLGLTLFDRETYDRAGGFRPGIRVGEDWDLYIRMVRSGARVHSADHPTELYRLTPGGLTWSDEGADDRVAVLEHASREAEDPEELEAIRAGLRTVRADRALVAAYRLAGEHRLWSARKSALSGLRGQRRVAIRSAAMMVAPRRVAAMRRQVRSLPTGRLRG